MGIFKKLGFSGYEKATIDWEITPATTFTIFESWGTKERSILSSNERYYYFFIDDWEKPAKVFLMERGIKYARVLAQVEAPQDKVDRCVAAQGSSIGLDRCYAIDEDLKEWLTENVLDSAGTAKIIPVSIGIDHENMGEKLPGFDDQHPEIEKVSLPSSSREVFEEEILETVKSFNFFESKHNPDGHFSNYLVDNKDGLTVTDLATGLMWQREGCDITSVRKMVKEIDSINENKFAGFGDWRLPTIEESLSLFETEANEKGVYLHMCFSKKQPFVFLSGKRSPGGYWYADFKQGTVFWASGFNPGGFGRLCRTVS